MPEYDETSSAILVVDDEESLRHTFQIFLKRQGYSPVIMAATFEEAVTAMTSQPFDLIISDIVLEGASGIDLLKRARELGLDCPVVMVTGYPNVETAADAVRLGAFDYIPKPVEKETLLRPPGWPCNSTNSKPRKKRPSWNGNSIAVPWKPSSAASPTQSSPLTATSIS